LNVNSKYIFIVDHIGGNQMKNLIMKIFSVFTKMYIVLYQRVSMGSDYSKILKESPSITKFVSTYTFLQKSTLPPKKFIDCNI